MESVPLAPFFVVLGLMVACSRSSAGEPDLHVAVIHVAGMQESATGAT